MENNLLVLIAFGSLIGLTALSWLSLHIERKRAIDRERTLLSALLSRPQAPTDFGAYMKSMKQGSGDIMREMELENDLVLAASKGEDDDVAGQAVV